jgi:hypothetical protein
VRRDAPGHGGGNQGHYRQRRCGDSNPQHLPRAADPLVSPPLEDPTRPRRIVFGLERQQSCAPVDEVSFAPAADGLTGRPRVDGMIRVAVEPVAVIPVVVGPPP